MSAVSVPSANVIVLIDIASASGGTIVSPSPQMNAWVLPIPAGSTALSTATAFANGQKYPAGTCMVVVDLSGSAATVGSYQLTSQWAAG